MSERKITFNEKWIDAEKSSFIEQKNKITGKSEYFLDAMIVPFNKVSRNGIKYGEAGIKRTHAMLVGKNLMHNHVLEGANTFPRGEWVKTWIGPEGMHARAKIYNTSYNKDYIEWLKAANQPRVSLQVTGDAKQVKDEKTETFHQEADINDWLEASTVNVPGFDDAKASLSVAMAEAFNGRKKEEAPNAPLGVQPIDHGEFGRKVQRQSDGSYRISLGDTTYTEPSLEDLWQKLKDNDLTKGEEEVERKDAEDRGILESIDSPEEDTVFEELFEASA